MRLALVWFVAAFLAFTCRADVTSLSESSKVEQEMLNGKLHERMETALDAAIKMGGYQLRKKGYLLEAASMEDEWAHEMRAEFHKWGEVQRDIGDHPDQILSQWLDDRYNFLLLTLGESICEKTHLTAIKIFNDTPKIIFRPCKFDMNAVPGDRIDEYRKNFAEGAIMYGGFSETIYWASYIGCSALTAGTGYVLICGGIGDVAEKIIATFVAPKLSDKIYTKTCG